MILEIPALSENVRTFKDPNGLDARRTVIALVQLSDMPEIPLNPDPRVPKANGNVFRTIKESALLNDGRFHEKNRGITLCVKSAEYDNKAKILVLNIPEDEGVYGIVDGGHTHSAIREAVRIAGRKLTTEEILEHQFVRIEVMTGVESNLSEIAGARNFSETLKRYTLENHEGNFDWFLKALGDKGHHVKVRENDPQPVVIMDLIQVMCAVNIVLYPDEGASPVDAYLSAGKCLANFVADNDPFKFRAYARIVPSVIALYDYIRLHWDEKYNEEDDAGRTGRIQQRVEMHRRQRNREAHLTFYFLEQDPVRKNGFPVEKGLAIPLISSFRALIKRGDDGFYEWEIDPVSFFDRHGTALVREVMQLSTKKDGDAHLVGRDSDAYRNLYRIALLRHYSEQIKGVPNTTMQPNSLFA